MILKEPNMTASAYYKALLGKMVLYGEISSNLNQNCFYPGIIIPPVRPAVDKPFIQEL